MNLTKPFRLIFRSSLVFVLPLVLISCGNKSQLSSHIPKDANVVLAFDVKSMGLKSLDFKELLSLENIKKAFSSLTEKDSVNALQNSGIDFMTRAYVFAKATEDGQYTGAAIGALSDAKKFEAFLKESDNSITIAQEGNFKVATLPGDNTNTAVAWNEKEVILSFGGQDPKAAVLALANLPKSESLTETNETFRDVEKASADIACWVSFESFSKLVPQTPGAPEMNLKETFLTATCNFEDGRIVVDTKYFGNKEMADKLSFIKSNVSKEIAGILPGGKVVGLAGFSLDMGKMYTYLEGQNLLDPYNASADAMTGMSVKEFLNLFSGDLAATVNGFQLNDVQTIDLTTGQPVTRKEPQADYCFVVGIADKDKVAKLLSDFAEKGMLTKEENYYSFQGKVFIAAKDNALVITGTESIRQDVLGGTGEKLNAELGDMLTSNASVFYFSLNNLPEDLFAANPAVSTGLKASELEDLYFTGSLLKGNVTEGKIVVRFKDKNQNSLITLSRISKKYSEWMKNASTPANNTFTLAAPADTTNTGVN